MGSNDFFASIKQFDPQEVEDAIAAKQTCLWRAIWKDGEILYVAIPVLRKTPKGFYGAPSQSNLPNYGPQPLEGERWIGLDGRWASITKEDARLRFVARTRAHIRHSERRYKTAIARALACSLPIQRDFSPPPLTAAERSLFLD